MSHFFHVSKDLGCMHRGFSYFFSSRRRRTSYWRDWSSDVCSSDLTITVRAGAADAGGARGVGMRFASILGIDRWDVRATSTAAWGYPRTFPHRNDGTPYPSLPLKIGRASCRERV